MATEIDFDVITKVEINALKTSSFLSRVVIRPMELRANSVMESWLASTD